MDIQQYYVATGERILEYSCPCSESLRAHILEQRAVTQLSNSDHPFGPTIRNKPSCQYPGFGTCRKCGNEAVLFCRAIGFGQVHVHNCKDCYK